MALEGGLFFLLLFSSVFFTFGDIVLVYQIHTIQGGHKEMSLLLNEDEGASDVMKKIYKLKVNP